MFKHLETRRRTLVKEFYANLGERRNLTCYVKGRWVPFGERAISQLFGLRQGGDCIEYEQLQKSPNFEEIAKEFTGCQGGWQRTKTISNSFLSRGDLTEINKLWFYLVNSVIKPSKHVSTVRQDRALLLYALVKGYSLNVGKIIEESILDYEQGNSQEISPTPL